eukprot:m.6388 g.6388  ORF g.6388 m.6388 type:complete len:655 (+) comp2625_c0_seq1:122-2086(+)
MGKVLVLYDSFTDCTREMAHMVAEGAAQVDGVEVRLRCVLDADAGDSVHWADGLAVGTPTNLGGISWQMKKFWDDWAAENWCKVDGKVACSFSSQGAHSGGGELTCMSMNHVLMNFGFLVFGVTDYVSPIQTLHYGATIAKKPRDDASQAACARLGLRLSEWVAVFFDRRADLHPLLTTKKQAAAAAEAKGKEAAASYEAEVAQLVKDKAAPVHLVVSIRVPRPNQESWLAMVKELVAISRKEVGCLHYAFARVDGDPTLFRVVELWETAAKLDKHSNSLHFKRLVPAMGKLSETLALEHSTATVALLKTPGELLAGPSVTHLVMDVRAADGQAADELCAALPRHDLDHPACVYSQLTQVKVEPSSPHFQYISVWRSRQALDAYLASPAHNELQEAVVATNAEVADLVIATSVEAEQPPAVLIFHKATEYYHESIPDAVAALMKICRAHGWKATSTEDAAVFHPVTGSLNNYQAIVFVSNSGTLFTSEEKQGLENYITQGRGGIFGVHAAIAAFLSIVDHTGATEATGTWPFYGNLLGAYFKNHPPVQEAKIKVNVDQAKLLGLGLPSEYKQTDEWYNLDRELPADITVVALADHTSYEGCTMEGDVPVIWHHRFGPKRVPVFCSTLGHLPESYQLETTTDILLTGLRFALGQL